MGFVGLRNFTGVIGTPKFQTALKNTIIFGFISQILILILSNALALSLQANFRGKRLIRFLMLLPWVAPISIGTIAWLWIFDSTYSVLNWMLRLAGLIHGAEKNRVDLKVAEQRNEDWAEYDNDLGPLQRPAEQEDNHLRCELKTERREIHT